MKYVSTFLVTGMQGAIQEEYIYIAEPVRTKSKKPVDFWLYTSPDLPNILILNIRKYACDDRVNDVLQKHWGQSNVFVTVKKIATTMIEDGYASK